MLGERVRISLVKAVSDPTVMLLFLAKLLTRRVSSATVHWRGFPVIWGHPRCRLWDYPSGAAPPTEEVVGWGLKSHCEETPRHSGKCQWPQSKQCCGSGYKAPENEQLPRSCALIERRCEVTSRA